MCIMRDGGNGGRKGKGAKEMCVPSLPRGILAAKGVNVRCEESPLVGKMCVGWAGSGQGQRPDMARSETRLMARLRALTAPGQHLAPSLGG